MKVNFIEETLEKWLVSGSLDLTLWPFTLQTALYS